MTKELKALNTILRGTFNSAFYEEETKIIETALKTNKKKLDVIGEILVDISKGNYADLNVAIDEIREVLL